MRNAQKSSFSGDSGGMEKKSHKVVPKHAGKVAGVGNVGAGKCNQ